MWLGFLLLTVVVALGTAGFQLLFDLTFVDALYQTITTITTIGFREVVPFDDNMKLFTIALALSGVGTALYTFGVVLETLVEGRLTDLFGRRRMQRRIDDMKGHVIVCGWGRVGRTIAHYVAGAGQDVVVIDRDPERVARVPYAVIEGDATDDAVLKMAGIERARTLVAAANTDPDNLYITLSGRSMGPELFIVARARIESAEPKLLQAGADRVVNPQHIGGARMAAFALQPHVAEFLDFVMHDGSLEFRLAEVAVQSGSPIVGRSLRDAHIRDRTGALVLALRNIDGSFDANPQPETVMRPGQVLIAIGTSTQLSALAEAAAH